MKLDTCPDLAMRQAILHAKRVLRETTIIENKLSEEGIEQCNQKSLEIGLQRAKELNLVTSKTKAAHAELRSLIDIRKRMASAVGGMKHQELNSVLAELNWLQENEGRKIVYSKMKNYPSFDMLQEMSPNLSTYLQLELAKMGTLNGDEGGFDSVVSLTLLVKEKLFSSKDNQKLYGSLKSFKGVRNLEEVRAVRGRSPVRSEGGFGSSVFDVAM